MSRSSIAVVLAIAAVGLLVGMLAIYPAIAGTSNAAVREGANPICDDAFNPPDHAAVGENKNALREVASSLPHSALTNPSCDLLLLPDAAIESRDIASMMSLPTGSRVTEMRGFIRGSSMVLTIGIGVDDGETLEAAIARAESQFRESLRENIDAASEPFPSSEDSFDNVGEEPPLPGMDDGSDGGFVSREDQDREAGRQATLRDNEIFLSDVTDGRIMIVAIRVVTDRSSHNQTVTDLQQLGGVLSVDRGRWPDGSVVTPDPRGTP